MDISIIVPVYNVAPYIERCLKSVGLQIFSGSCECILVDDAGSDNSIAIAKKWIQEYHGSIFFRIVRHGSNRGLSASRNTGVEAACGKFVYFLDSDDAITPDCLEILIKLARKYPDIDFVQANIVSGDEELMETIYDYNIQEYCHYKEELIDVILQKTNRTAWNRLIKRSFIMSNTLLFPEGLLMEDHHWTWFLSKYTKAAAFTSKGTYFYYRNQQSIVNSVTKEMLEKRYSSYLMIAEIIFQDLNLLHKSSHSQRLYVAEAFIYAMQNVSRLASLSHWWHFWRSVLSISKKKGYWNWQERLLLLCLMPPLCFLINIKPWKWRLRYYLLKRL